MQMNLLFYDQQIKKIDPLQICLEKGKKVRTKKYVIKQSRKGVHQYVPTVFEGQYYGLANVTLHTVCLDYRFRMSDLQLYQFSQMTALEKKQLLDKNRKVQSK